MTTIILERCDGCNKIMREEVLKEFDAVSCLNKLSYCEECKKKLGEDYVKKKSHN